jgi:flagellar biosynthesis protein FliP
MRLVAILVLWVTIVAAPLSLHAQTKNSCELSGCELATSCNAESNTSSNTLKTVSLVVVIAIASVFLARNQKNKWYLVGGVLLCIALLTSLLIVKPQVSSSKDACYQPFNPNNTIGKNIFLPPGNEFIHEESN